MYMSIYMHTPERSGDRAELAPDAAGPVLNKPVVVCGHIYSSMRTHIAV